MKLLATLACVLFLASCAPINPAQSPEQKLQNKCFTFYETLDDALIYDLSLKTLERLEEAEQAADVLCRDNGPLLEGMTAEAALRVLERRLEQAVLAKQEGAVQ